MNIVAITGRLTKDPELRHTQSGTPVASFCVAVGRPSVKDKADFIDVVAWRKTAEFVSKYFHKGDPIEVTGVLTTRNYEDRDGNKRKSTEVNADRIDFPKGKKAESDGSNAPEPDLPPQEEGFQEIEGDDEGVPF